jgi:uncharacterized cupin superfamily protein
MITTDAIALELEREAVPSAQVLEGSPDTGWVELESTGQGEWGVWEMTPGAMSDVEVDETFVVVAGRGSVERTVNGQLVVEELYPGVCVTLVAGEETIWRGRQTLRKVYFAPAP